MREIFEFAPHGIIDTRSKFAKLKISSRKTNTGQKAISFVGPSLWKSLPDLIETTDNSNTFKHNAKNYCLNSYYSHCYYFKDLAILTYIYFYSLKIFFYFFPSLFNISESFLLVLCYPSHFYCSSYFCNNK